MERVFARLAHKSVTVETPSSFGLAAGYTGAINDYECGGHTAMNAYLAGRSVFAVFYASFCPVSIIDYILMCAYLCLMPSEPSVIEALHVLPNTPGMTYTKTAGDLMPLYSELMKKYQVLIYSGDTDGIISFFYCLS